MVCADKLSLTKKYRLYVRAYKDAVEQLSLISSKAAKAGWDMAYEIATREHKLCDDALLQLQKHTEEHGC
jgi:hypothetical protein